MLGRWTRLQSSIPIASRYNELQERYMTEEEGFTLTHEQQIANLRDEYKANVDLWIYESTFRQQRSEAFLNINTILLTALGILITISPSIRNSSIVGVLIAIFGLLTCTIWRQILLRNSAYMRFRRYQLRG
jgi:hypothetical protein